MNYLKHWKQKLNQLEQAKKWHEAIEFMKEVIEQNPDEMDTYIFMNYLLINLLAEEEYDPSKENYYIDLCKKYFQQSYSKFSHKPEYLYLMGKMAVMGPWFFGIDQVDYENMIREAIKIEPENILYQDNYFYNLAQNDPQNPELSKYLIKILNKNSSIEMQLKNKGALGKYILSLKKHWAERIFNNLFHKSTTN